NRRLVGRVESRSKRGSLRHNAVQVLAGAVAVEKLILFDILQTISTARIDVGGERRSVVHDLARSLEDVRNRANRRGKQVKCDVRLRLRVAFRNRTGVVGEAGLLDELDARLRRGAGSKQVADGKLTIRRSDDAGNTMTRNQRRTSRTASTDSGITGSDISALSLNADRATPSASRIKRLERLGVNELVAVSSNFGVLRRFLLTRGALFQLRQARGGIAEFGQCLVDLAGKFGGNFAMLGEF